jgi:hypothetical protein
MYMPITFRTQLFKSSGTLCGVIRWIRPDVTKARMHMCAEKHEERRNLGNYLPSDLTLHCHCWANLKCRRLNVFCVRQQNFTFSTRDFCTAPVRRKAGDCSLGSNSVIMTAAVSCCKIWDSQRWREQVSPKPRWHFKDHDFVQQNTWVLTFLQMFVEFIAF